MANPDTILKDLERRRDQAVAAVIEKFDRAIAAVREAYDLDRFETPEAVTTAPAPKPRAPRLTRAMAFDAFVRLGHEHNDGMAAVGDVHQEIALRHGEGISEAAVRRAMSGLVKTGMAERLSDGVWRLAGRAQEAEPVPAEHPAVTQVFDDDPETARADDTPPIPPEFRRRAEPPDDLDEAEPAGEA